MHPDQAIFHTPPSVKIVTAIAVILYFSAFSWIIYGFAGKHLGPTTSKEMPKKENKIKNKKYEHVKGYKLDSRRLSR